MRLAATLILPLFLGGPLAWADGVSVCYNYGCNVEAPVEFSSRQLDYLRVLMSRPRDASSERLVLSDVLGRMYRMAGAQTPIWRDKGGNTEDDAVEGRMDCIDHSTTSTRFLELLADKGWLHFHQVKPRQMRRRGLIFEHWTAVLQETASGEMFAVDSWFGDHGEPVAVIPMGDWLDGKDPEIQHRVAEAVQEQMDRQEER
ncbi:MAG TPA: hypothetical protein VJ548_01540 [Azospira sp.]|nr:hypothetical protein [Azospira sp.]